MSKSRGEFTTEYNRIHKWLSRHLNKTGVCAFCGNEGFTEWSNKSGNYTQEAIDYEELCRSCHKIYDYRVMGIKMGMQTFSKEKRLAVSKEGVKAREA